MNRLLASCLFCTALHLTGLLALSGCSQTESEPSAQTPATDAEDRQEVMKPVMDELPDQTNADQPISESTPTEQASEGDDQSEEAKP